MTNPFHVRWLQGWTFEVMLMDGKVQVEATGFGISLRTPLYPGESPVVAADRLVLAEDRRRRALYQAWIRDQAEPGPSAPTSVVVVKPQPVAV
ncbi:MAG: copper-binding protein [Synechococcus sp.]|nr:copper-binding protein [Synechococcus sp.]